MHPKTSSFNHGIQCNIKGIKGSSPAPDSSTVILTLLQNYFKFGFRGLEFYRVWK